MYRSAFLLTALSLACAEPTATEAQQVAFAVTSGPLVLQIQQATLSGTVTVTRFTRVGNTVQAEGSFEGTQAGEPIGGSFTGVAVNMIGTPFNGNRDCTQVDMVFRDLLPPDTEVYALTTEPSEALCDLARAVQRARKNGNTAALDAAIARVNAELGA